MYEENKVSQQSEERPYPVRAYGRERPVREPQEEEKPRDFLLRVILTQSALCIVIALVAFAVMKTGGERLENAKQSYWALFSEDMEREELVETFKSVSNFLFKPQNDLAKLETTAPAETTSSPVTTAQSTEAQNAESLDGAGGEDLLYPDKTASFAPLTVSGSFCVPVEYTKVTSAFGYRENPVTGEQGFHGGIDLAAPSGTPIYAAFSGQVTTVSYSEVRGNYVILTHGSGLQTVYCHCSEILVEEGANIRGGEVIAKVGSTGQSTGPHLHFEVRLDSVRYNPAWLLF